MRKLKYKSLSQSVFDRLAAKRVRNRLAVIRLSLVVLALSGMAFFEYTSYAGMKAAQQATVPTWAGFKINPPGDASKQLFETIGSHYSDGVPINLIINGEEWSIVKADIFDDALKNKPGKSFNGVQAETYCNNKTIAYIPATDPRRLRINLMHEVFHAGGCLHGGDTWWNSINPTRNEHIGVYHLGEFMAVFVHDNPYFMEWEENWGEEQK